MASAQVRRHLGAGPRHNRTLLQVGVPLRVIASNLGLVERAISLQSARFEAASHWQYRPVDDPKMVDLRCRAGRHRGCPALPVALARALVQPVKV